MTTTKTILSTLFLAVLFFTIAPSSKADTIQSVHLSDLYVEMYTSKDHNDIIIDSISTMDVLNNDTRSVTILGVTNDTLTQPFQVMKSDDTVIELYKDNIDHTFTLSMYNTRPITSELIITDKDTDFYFSTHR